MACSLSLSMILFFFLSCTTHSTSAINRRGGFTVDLFHRNSPQSPTYNASFFESEAMMATMKLLAIDSDVAYSGSADYIMKLSIGTPPVELHAVLDTGSKIIWSQCEPCEKCYEQTLPVFDSRASSTYRSLEWNSYFCKDFGEDQRSHNQNGKCGYLYQYADGSNTSGLISSETLTFGSLYGGEHKIDRVVFGCGSKNQGIYHKKMGGVVGLGRDRLSLISQLGSSVGNKFSYCLVLGNSRHTSKLKFGDHATFSGNGRLQSTPFLDLPGSHQRYYYLKLIDISVNNRRLDIPTSSVTPRIDGGGFFIDSGTSHTLLTSQIYRVLASAMRDTMVNLKEIQGLGGFSLCYKYNPSRDHSGTRLPSVTLHFDGGANWPLGPKYTFLYMPDAKDVICSSFVSTEKDFSIFGSYMQRNMYVEYDLGRKVLSFAPTDCSSG